jgi:hypothetical protein
LDGSNSRASWPCVQRMGYAPPRKAIFSSGQCEHALQCRPHPSPPVRLGNPRHTFAGRLNEGGASPMTVAQMLGDASTGIVQTYAHVLDNAQRHCIRQLGEHRESYGQRGPDVQLLQSPKPSLDQPQGMLYCGWAHSPQIMKGAQKNGFVLPASQHGSCVSGCRRLVPNLPVSQESSTSFRQPKSGFGNPDTHNGRNDIGDGRRRALTSLLPARTTPPCGSPRASPGR